MRVAAVLALTFLGVSLPAAHAAEPADAGTLATWADKAQHAGVKDQCYLYAKLVHGGTALAAQELAAGDRAASQRMLASVETYAASMETALARDSKKLKDTEILLRESAFHLESVMLSSSVDDRPAMQHALSHIHADEAKIMAAVFAQ